MHKNYILKHQDGKWIFDQPLIIMEWLYSNQEIIYTYGNEIRAIVNIGSQYFKIFINNEYIDINIGDNERWVHMLNLEDEAVEYFNALLNPLEDHPESTLINLFIQLKTLIGKITIMDYKYYKDMLSAVAKIPKNPYK